MRNNLYKIATAALALAITFTLSCSSGDDGGDPSGNGDNSSEGYITTFDIKNLNGTSFTVIDKHYFCQENGTFEEVIYEYPTSYSIDGTTLSFGGVEFSGSSNSIIGTWNSSSLDLENTVRFYGNSGGAGDMEKVEDVLKVVFTQTSITFTSCPDSEHYALSGDRYIDCTTWEYIKISGTDTVIVVVDSEKQTATFNNKTCTSWLPKSISKSKKKAACTEAFNRAKAEGYDGSGDLVENYFDDILHEDAHKCLEEKKFPEWFYYN